MAWIPQLPSCQKVGETGWHLEVHDLAIAKLAAGREKDLDFVNELVTNSYVRKQVLEERLAQTSMAEALRPAVHARLRALPASK
jgi:hypothetical protein